MATLKSLVDETTNIKNELVECHSNLKNNLIAKGVECSEDDKMSSLIDKLSNIVSVKSPLIIGDESFLFFQIENLTKEGTSFSEIGRTKIDIKGSYRIRVSWGTSHYLNNTSSLTINQVREGIIISTYPYTTTSNTTNTVLDINTEKGDDIVFLIKNSSSSHYTNISYVKILGQITLA